MNFFNNINSCPEFRRTYKKCVLVMRLITFMFTIFALNISATVYSQNTKLSLDIHNATIKDVLQQIESSTEFRFIYESGKVDMDKKISIHAKELTVEDILDQIFRGKDINYMITENKLILIDPWVNKVDLKGEAVGAIVVQGITISGTVTDKGDPLPGASVVVKGSAIGTATDINGRYQLTVPNENAVLEYSFVGYVTQEFTVGNQRTINVALAEDLQQIEEVVVVGYGTMRKSDVTGSVGQVQASTLENKASIFVDQALVGQVAGVQVMSTTGQPGEGLSLRVRGVGSISAGTSPLYVVDGFPEANLQMLNPNDIETIDILKDASATAIYGSRGANGVVLITTKRGREGKSTINLDVYYGMQKVLHKPKYISMMEQAQYYYDGILNENLDAGNDVSGDPLKWRTPMPATIMRTLAGEIKQTDPFDYIFQTAPQQNYSLSVRGGTNKLRYSVSGSYMSQDGVIITSDFKRYTVRANIDAQVNQRINMKFNVTSSYSFGTNIRASGGNYGGEGMLGTASIWLYHIPLYNEDGSYVNGYFQDTVGALWNPMAQADLIKREQESFRTMGNWVTDINITNDLHLNILLGANNANSNFYSFVPKSDLFQTPGEGRDDRSSTLNWLSEFMLNYQKSINNHSINAMIGYTTQKNNYSSGSMMSQTYANNLVHTLNAASNPITQGSSEESQWSIVSYLARINYNYNSKYYLTTSIRADGSSRFGKDNKYGYFPSAAVMWRVSEETFLKDVSSINNLRLRASYGATGNNSIGNYAHLATVSYPTYAHFGGGMAPSNLENNTLTWEKQNSINFGVDVGLFKSRVNLTADYFITTNHQLLLNVDVPQTTGFSTSLVNIGEVRNNGWEISLNTHNLKGVVDWKTSLNFTAYRNEVMKLGPEGAPLISDTHITQIGSPIGMFYGYKTDGVFKNQAELDAGPIYSPGSSDRSRVGDVRFKDVSGPNGVPDGVITSDDRTIIGSPHPDFYYGMTNTFAYKNFDFSFSISGSKGNSVSMSSDYAMCTRGRFKTYDKDTVTEWWKSESDPGNGKAPRPNNSPKGGVRQRSDRFLDDATYLRVNNINLSYTFPSKIAQSLHLENVRVYVTSNNPFMFTKYNEFNPEVSNNTGVTSPGMQNWNYPLAKSLLLGINVTF